jgi:hypothetical protein
MLDLRAVTGTPGAATVLGATFPTICTNDGSAVAGVPISPSAVLVGWGGHSIAANTLGAIKLFSQDMVDPINGEWVQLGAASIVNQFFKQTQIPYRTGLRGIQMGTNTGVGAGIGFTLDQYGGGPVINGDRKMPGQVVTGPTTFGGALTTLVWGSQAYAPATAIPNGRYAILGWVATAITNVALIRFQHADFGQFLPGMATVNPEIISTSSWDKVWKDDTLITHQGYQFVNMSEELGFPCCPVFSVSNAGTGLNIQMLTIAADTPVVHLFLAKVG